MRGIIVGAMVAGTVMLAGCGDSGSGGTAGGTPTTQDIQHNLEQAGQNLKDAAQQATQKAEPAVKDAARQAQEAVHNAAQDVANRTATQP